MMAGPGPAGAAGSSPARFDVYGNPCNSTAWTKRCPFEVYAQFTPACGGPGVCNRAVSISVHFQLRGPRGGSYLTSGDGTHLPIFELVSGAIDVNAILPPTPTQIAQNSNGNVQVQQYSGSDDSSGSSTDEIDWSKVNPAIAAGLNTGPLPSNTTEVISALTNSGVTDPTILTILARAWVNEAGDARAIADTITAAGITDVNLMGVLVQGWVEDPAQATQIASELAASGIRYDNIVAQVTLGALVHYGVTDPTTLAAMFNALASQDGLGYYYSAQKVAIAGATDPAQVAAILKEIEGEPSSDTSSTTLSSTSGGSDGGSGTSSPGAPAPPPPPPMHTLNTCSGPQCATGY
jgi:hypothetical protein